VLLLYQNASLLLEPVCYSFNIQVLVKRQGAKAVAGLTALVEYNGVVPILGISPD
jgi:hypothetical protein